MDANLKQYFVTALWSSTDDKGGSLDSKYELDDISEEAVKKSKEEWELFQQKAGALLDGLDLTDVSHDFWLTRNRHGAGFWDGDYEKSIGEALTNISHEFKEVDIYVGDDKKIHLSNE